MHTGIHEFGQEPSVSSYIAGLNAADLRWQAAADDMLMHDDLGEAAFDPMAMINTTSNSEISGTGGFEGWTLCVRHDRAEYQGAYLRFHDETNSSSSRTVGYIEQSRDGTWRASHDPYNMRPGLGVDSCGTKVRMPSADAARRYVVMAHTRYLGKGGRV